MNNDRQNQIPNAPTRQWLRSFAPGTSDQKPSPLRTPATNPAPSTSAIPVPQSVSSENFTNSTGFVPPQIANQQSGSRNFEAAVQSISNSSEPAHFGAPPQSAPIGVIAPVKKSRKELKSDKIAQNREFKLQQKQGSNKREKADLSFQSMNKYLGLSYLVLVVLVFLVGGWAYFSEIKGAVVASGTVAVEGKPKIVQHLDGGVVSEIFFVDGDYVEKGVPIMKLDSSIVNATHVATQTAFFENEALISRLQAEKSKQSNISWSKSLRINNSNPRAALAMQGQQQLFEARRIAMNGGTNQLQQRISKLQSDDMGLASEIDFTRSELTIIDPELNKFRRLLQQGLVPRSRITQFEIDKTRLENQIAKLQSQRQNNYNSIQEIKIEIEQMRRVRREEILAELRDAQTQADMYAQDLKAASTKSGQIEIRAPSSGTIHNSLVTTIGGVIAPGQEIMQIIPRLDKLKITARIAPQDIDQVAVNQETNVIFSALNRKMAPELTGVVTHISADAILDEAQGMPFYTVDIEIADAEKDKKLRGLELIAGMPADVFIQTGSRSVMDYLLEPAKNALSKTMRDG